MSEHKTKLSNWDADTKKHYWERKDKGLRGQVGAVVVYRTVEDDKGNLQRIPVSGKYPPKSNGPRRKDTSKNIDPSFTKKGEWRQNKRHKLLKIRAYESKAGAGR